MENMNVAGTNIRVLIVDDEPEFTGMVATILEREMDRFETYTADSVDEGAEILRKISIDCVVSDYRMPKKNGLEFLDSIREEHGELPFVLLTGQGDEEIASEAISAGVTDYIRKDRARGQYSLLATRITNAVEKRRARRALGRRKRELESLNERFQSFVRHSPDLITVLDEDGIIQYDSPAIEHVLGYDQDDLTGEPVIDSIHPDDHDRVQALFEESGDIDGTRESFEYRIRHADGSWRWIESIAIRQTEGTGSGYLMYSRDISDRKARERQLEGKTERLEEFASIVSHDLQTPITVADARLELAREECDSEHLPAIGDALARMEEIINATLTLAREGRVVDETEPIDLVEAAERWWATVATNDAVLEIEADELVVSADRERLRRVMENLFANAVEHGVSDEHNPSDDAPMVTVFIGELEEGSGFYIADDGPGIPEAQRETVFEPGHSMSPDGTGFGLAIVEEIVEAHGWEIKATESETGGARFEIIGVDVV